MSTATTIDFKQVRADNDLWDIVESSLGPPGKGNKWSCPFHDDGKNPNLTVKGNHWRCWSSRCNAHGDVTDFVRRIQRLENAGEAARWLCDQPVPRSPSGGRNPQRPPTPKTPDLSTLAGRVEQYHSQVKLAMDYWRGQGLSIGTIDRYKLGYTEHCPTCRKSPSYVIPVYQSGNLVSIRHRLKFPNASGKYRPEFAGLPAQPFNLDCLEPDPGANGEISFSRWLLPEGEAILVEGEIKAMALDQRGFRAVGIPGATSWQAGWVTFFEQMSKIYICLDPDVDEGQIEKIAGDFLGMNREVVRVQLTCKPDDFFVLYGGTQDQFRFHLGVGRMIR